MGIARYRITYYMPVALASPYARYSLYPFERLLARVERDIAMARKLLDAARYWQSRGMYLEFGGAGFLVQVQNIMSYLDRMRRLLRDFITGIRTGNMGLALRAYYELCRQAQLRPSPVWLTQLYDRLARGVGFTEMCLHRILDWYRGTILQYVLPASTIRPWMARGWWFVHAPL